MNCFLQCLYFIEEALMTYDTLSMFSKFLFF